MCGVRTLGYHIDPFNNIRLNGGSKHRLHINFFLSHSFIFNGCNGINSKSDTL